MGPVGSKSSASCPAMLACFTVIIRWEKQVSDGGQHQRHQQILVISSDQQAAACQQHQINIWAPGPHLHPETQHVIANTGRERRIPSNAKLVIISELFKLN